MNLRDIIDAFGTSEGVTKAWDTRGRSAGKSPGAPGAPVQSSGAKMLSQVSDGAGGTLTTYAVNSGKGQHVSAPAIGRTPTVIHVHEKVYKDAVVHETAPSGQKTSMTVHPAKLAGTLKSKYGIKHNKAFSFKMPGKPKTAKAPNVRYSPTRTGKLAEGQYIARQLERKWQK